MEWFVILIIGVVLFIVLAIFFRRSINALIYDYVIDLGLSLIDGPLPFGDIAAAILIFIKERKISGGLIAVIVAWEALNFLPVGLIPGFEIVTNLFPAVFVSRLFSKFGIADRMAKLIKKNLSLAKRLGMNVKKQEKNLKAAENMIKSEDPVDAIKIMKGMDKVDDKLVVKVNEIIEGTNKGVQNITKLNVQASPEQMKIIQDGINEAQRLSEEAVEAANKKNFEKAMGLAADGRNTLVGAAEKFDESFQQ